jgi:hypothetical protein
VTSAAICADGSNAGSGLASWCRTTPLCQIRDDTDVYEVAAKLELRCCDGHVAVAGFEALEEYEFFKGE